MELANIFPKTKLFPFLNLFPFQDGFVYAVMFAQQSPNTFMFKGKMSVVKYLLLLQFL